MDYTRAILAVSSGDLATALDHLGEAVKTARTDFVFAERDPLMVEIVQLPEFHALKESVVSIQP